jgi:hypothetical protein
MHCRLHPRLWARVVDILQYRARFIPPRVKSRVPSALMMESVGEWSQLEGELDPLEESLATSLSKPAHMPSKARLHRGPAMHILFDGGSKSGLGTAGYVLIGRDGKEIERTGIQLA